MKVLVTIGATQLNKVLVIALKRSFFDVDSALDADSAIKLIKENKYHTIIIDMTSSKTNGAFLLKYLKDNNIDSPTLLLLDRDMEIKACFDDCIYKPFIIEELINKVKTLSGKKPSFKEKTGLEFGDLYLETSDCILFKKTSKVQLTNREAHVLSVLMERNGKVTTIDYIQKEVWDDPSDATSQNVWVFISYLRKKMQIIKSSCKIKMLRGKGYSLEYKE